MVKFHILGRKCIAFRGATAYEFQVGRVYWRIVHLEGAKWRGKPWRRFSGGIDRTG